MVDSRGIGRGKEGIEHTQVTLPEVSFEIKNSLQMGVMKSFGCRDTVGDLRTDRWVTRASDTFHRLLSQECPPEKKVFVFRALDTFHAAQSALGQDTVKKYHDEAVQIMRECLMSELGENFMDEDDTV